eukprot:m.136499 g.136499  ORF g.136499 m.136499 type:complete len:364 (-) comp52474_c0_seq12:163-1254(-)
MAAFIRLTRRQADFVPAFIALAQAADAARPAAHSAAVRIQSLIRSCLTRVAHQQQVNAAVFIQKIYRGWLARKLFRGMLLAALRAKKLAYYNANATRIQKMWRGFYSRKYIHNFYTRKAYLYALTLKNTEVKRFIDEQAESKAQQEHTRLLVQSESLKQEKIRTAHFLLSTTAIPGVCSTTTSGRGVTDDMLRQSMRSMPTLRARGAAHHSDTTASVPVSNNLPSPPQGPFKSPDQVLRLKNKPINTTLRTQTDFEAARKALWVFLQIDLFLLAHSCAVYWLACSLEDVQKEWRGRITDKPFLPPSSTFPAAKVEGYLNATSPFIGNGPGDVRMMYGRKHFREEEAELAKSRVRFLDGLFGSP